MILEQNLLIIILHSTSWLLFLPFVTRAYEALGGDEADLVWWDLFFIPCCPVNIIKYSWELYARHQKDPCLWPVWGYNLPPLTWSNHFLLWAMDLKGCWLYKSLWERSAGHHGRQHTSLNLHTPLFLSSSYFLSLEQLQSLCFVITFLHLYLCGVVVHSPTSTAGVVTTFVQRPE